MGTVFSFSLITVINELHFSSSKVELNSELLEVCITLRMMEAKLSGAQERFGAEALWRAWQADLIWLHTVSVFSPCTFEILMHLTLFLRCSTADSEKF